MNIYNRLSRAHSMRMLCFRSKFYIASACEFCLVCFALLFLADELGYLVDAIVNDDMIETFDKRPNDMSIEVKEKFKFGTTVACV